MTTILFSGAPSVGKSTLAMAFSNLLATFGYTVHHVEEVSKRGIETVRPITVQHYLLSAKTQLDIQQRCEAEYMVIDSPVFLYGIYAHRILKVTDKVEYQAYTELKSLCGSEIRKYRNLDYKLFHIHSAHQLELDIMEYIDTMLPSHIRIAARDLMNRLECVISYLDIPWWDGNIKPAPSLVDEACESAEMSILHDHTFSDERK